MEEAFPEENWTQIPLSRGRALQRAGRVCGTRLCLPAHLAPAGTRSQFWRECGWHMSPTESRPWPPPSRISSVHLQRQLGLVSAVLYAQKALFHCKIWLLLVIGWLSPLLAISNTLFARGVLAFSPKRIKTSRFRDFINLLCQNSFVGSLSSFSGVRVVSWTGQQPRHPPLKQLKGSSPAVSEARYFPASLGCEITFGSGF